MLQAEGWLFKNYCGPNCGAGCGPSYCGAGLAAGYDVTKCAVRADCGPSYCGARRGGLRARRWPICEARRGEARRGEARRGEARRGEARRGEARRGEARRGEARRGEARRGEARRGEAGCGLNCNLRGGLRAQISSPRRASAATWLNKYNNLFNQPFSHLPGNDSHYITETNLTDWVLQLGSPINRPHFQAMNKGFLHLMQTFFTMQTNNLAGLCP